MLLEAGGEVGVVPGSRVPSLAAWGPSLRAVHENAIGHKVGTTLRGVYLAPCAGATPCVLGNNKEIIITGEQKVGFCKNK